MDPVKTLQTYMLSLLTDELSKLPKEPNFEKIDYANNEFVDSYSFRIVLPSGRGWINCDVNLKKGNFL